MVVDTIVLVGSEVDSEDVWVLDTSVDEDVELDTSVVEGVGSGERSEDVELDISVEEDSVG